jgi:heavy metal sensor kinase
MNSLSLRTRLTIWCVVVVVAVLGFSAVNVLVIQQRIGLRRVDRELDLTHTQLANMLREELRELDTPKLAAEESRDVIASPRRVVAVLREDGEVLAASSEGLRLDEIFTGAVPTPGARTVETRDGTWRVDLRPETLGGMTLLLAIASPLDDLARDQQELREAIVLGIPVALLLAGLGGLWLASVSLRPITRMARRAADISTSGLEDLGPPLRDDEIGRLTGAFNDLVARLRSALVTQRQFMADASHELRSPVSVIRTASDVALSRDHRIESEYREALTMTAEQSRRLGSLVEDMLVLARADAGGYPLRPTTFYLDDLLDECRRTVGVLAGERQVALTFTGASDVVVDGDQELLGRMLVNVLQNAVQHTPSEGRVAVDVGLDARDVRIRVIDSGAGIAGRDVDRIFDRFVQLDPSRRSEGAGLGLTIAKWIAEVHGGSVTVESSGPHGTTFLIALPRQILTPEETLAGYVPSRAVR